MWLGASLPRSRGHAHHFKGPSTQNHTRPQVPEYKTNILNPSIQLGPVEPLDHHLDHSKTLCDREFWCYRPLKASASFDAEGSGGSGLRIFLSLHAMEGSEEIVMICPYYVIVPKSAYCDVLQNLIHQGLYINIGFQREAACSSVLSAMCGQNCPTGAHLYSAKMVSGPAKTVSTRASKAHLIRVLGFWGSG